MLIPPPDFFWDWFSINSVDIILISSIALSHIAPESNFAVLDLKIHSVISTFSDYFM